MTVERLLVVLVPGGSARSARLVRVAAPLFVASLLLASCGGGDDLGAMTAREARQVCLDRASGVVSPSEVNRTVTHKDDRYWDILLGVDPPQNLAWCTVNAVDGEVLRFTHGFTRRAAERALDGGLWDDAA